MDYDNLGRRCINDIEKSPVRKVIDEFGDCYYYDNNITNYNELHREDGPAVELLCGYKAWYIHGKHHRLDGPAVIFQNGIEEQWYVNGQLHRENGPAVIEHDTGDKEWWIKGKRHRENGPATEFGNGDFIYYLNDSIHRSDGPAVKLEGKFEYWINGVRLTEEQFLERQNNETK